MSDELPPICFAMAQDILEYKVPRVGKHIPGVFDVPMFTGDQVAAAVARERAMWKPLCVEIEANMRREWDARRLPAECWPTDLAQRLVAAIRGGD